MVPQPPSTSTTTFSNGIVNNDTTTQPTPPTTVHYGNKMVRCRIDRGVPLDEIIRQLCASPQLAVSDDPSLFALRDATTNELVTMENITRLTEAQASLKLVASPGIEAAETVERLRGGDNQAIKLATFALRSQIEEDTFLQEFVKQGGVTALASIIQHTSGNTLAYALSAMQSILDLDKGYRDLSESFTPTVIHIISTQALVNIVRPALSILRKLVSSRHTAFGFTTVWPVMLQDERLFPALAMRLSREGDKLVTGGVLSLMNATTRPAPKNQILDVLVKLEGYSFRKAVISLIENKAEDITPQILEFQQTFANMWHELQLQPVDLTNPKHVTMLETIYERSGLANATASPSTSQNHDYRKLGFAQNPPDIVNDFQDVGVLGLHTLHQIATTRRDQFSNMVLEQVNRPNTRRCPIALVSLQVTRILSDQYDLSGSLASASFQPFLLDFYRIHLVVMEFFIRMYSESGATLADFVRVSTLVISQVHSTLGPGALEYQSAQSDVDPRPFYAIQQEFEAVKYKDVRDRQMKEMEVEDDLSSKLPVRSLRDKLYRENFEFVREQRIKCLQTGAWFASPSTSNATSSSRQRTLPPGHSRYYRLAPNRRFLHYLESSSESRTTPAGLNDLPDFIDLNQVTDVIGGQHGRSSRTHQGSRSEFKHSLSPTSLNSSKTQTSAGDLSRRNPLSITIMNQGSILAELNAPDEIIYSEWLDGLNLLLPDGLIAPKETAEIIEALTDVGVKIRLLDLTGERLEIPTAIPTPMVPPPTVPFYYAD